MKTQTTLTAATWASPEEHRVDSEPQRYLGGGSSRARCVGGIQWHRHSCLPTGTKGLCAFVKPRLRRIEAVASLSPEIPWPPWQPIANLELESKLSAIRISDLKFSNRKYSAISCPEARRVHPARILPFRFSSHQSRATSHCISNRYAAIGITHNCKKTNAAPQF